MKGGSIGRGRRPRNRRTFLVPRVRPEIDVEEALCKVDGFTCAPSETVYWQHGRSTERDFIYVTTQSLSRQRLAALSEEVGDERSLLVYCMAFQGSATAFANLTVKKIPNAVLRRCEWGAGRLQSSGCGTAARAGDRRSTKRGAGRAPAPVTSTGAPTVRGIGVGAGHGGSGVRPDHDRAASHASAGCASRSAGSWRSSVSAARARSSGPTIRSWRTRTSASRPPTRPLCSGTRASISRPPREGPPGPRRAPACGSPAERGGRARSTPPGETIRDFREPVEPGRDIRSLLFGGFTRCAYIAQRFQSDPERRFAVILEGDPDVLEWMKPGPRQLQIYYRGDQSYEPDFVVETTTEKLLCGPKAAGEIAEPEVLDKARVAALWCRHATDHARQNGGKPWRYLLISHDAIDAGRTLAGLARQFEVRAQVR
jgi:hypothetical protein